MNGKPSEMEGHLVHARSVGDTKELAVVGVLMKAGAANAFLQEIWNVMPAVEGEVSVADMAIDPAALLPAGQAYHAYDGSLTTPPCSEGVKWYVLDQAIELSAEQIKAFGKLFEGGTARPVQPLCGREVKASR